jgi:hypothetical protein
MIDPEVARLRRLRSEALLVRELARTFESSPWAANESLLGRSACASWRIARLVSGRLKGHPYAKYQKDAGIATQAGNRLQSHWLAMITKGRLKGLKVLEARVASLARHLDDAISLAWSSDFSEAMSRSQFEIRSLAVALSRETHSGATVERVALRPSRSEGMSGEITAALEGDWPYLAF